MILYAAFQREYSSALPRRSWRVSATTAAAAVDDEPHRTAPHRTALMRRRYRVFYAAQLFSHSTVALDPAVLVIVCRTTSETQERS